MPENSLYSRQCHHIYIARESALLTGLFRVCIMLSYDVLALCTGYMEVSWNSSTRLHHWYYYISILTECRYLWFKCSGGLQRDGLLPFNFFCSQIAVYAILYY